MALLLLAASVEAQSTIRVPSDQPTVQAGIDAAAPGDVVLIEAGQYLVNGLDTLGKELTLKGESGAAQTVLDGGLVGNILAVQNGEGADLVIEGLTFFRGLASTARGGALDVSGNATPTIVDCVFDRNVRPVSGDSATIRIVDNAGATFIGTELVENEDLPILLATPRELTLTACTFRANSFGGIEVQNGGSLTIDACTFEDNTGQTVVDDGPGGAASVAITSSTFRANVGAITLNQSESVRIEDCVVEDKSAAGPVAVRVSGASMDLVVRNTRFAGNVSSSAPGALQASDLNSLVVEDCEFEGNQSLLGVIEGGAAALGSTGPGLVRRCKFVGNECGDSAGALRLLGNTRVENCVFLDNVAGGVGGAIFSLDPSEEIDHCTFVGNQAGVTGGAVATQAALTIRSSIFWSNTPGSIDGLGAAIDVAHCLVEGGFPGAGNLDTDPLFVQAVPGDFHLSLGSPCRDAGAPGAPAPTTDIDGDPRLIDGAVDMGADEVLEQPYVGTNEDLALATLIDGGGNPVEAIKAPLPGSVVTVHLDSPAGMFADSTYMLLAEFAPTGVALPPAAVPGLDLNPFSPQFVIVFDSLGALPVIGGLKLGEAGFGVDFAVPAGLTGQSLYTQGVAFGPGAANGVYAISNAHEVILP
ncbi:MAG: right-handed parallel beta-helix repeat-containing protein [Planctomycetota bacterium]